MEFSETSKNISISNKSIAKSRNEKENHQTASILPPLPKRFACCMNDQLNNCFDKILSKYHCGFRKGFSTQHCSLAMIEKLRKTFDSEGTDLSLTDLSRFSIV